MFSVNKIVGYIYMSEAKTDLACFWNVVKKLQGVSASQQLDFSI